MQLTKPQWEWMATFNVLDLNLAMKDQKGNDPNATHLKASQTGLTPKFIPNLSNQSEKKIGHHHRALPLMQYGHPVTTPCNEAVKCRQQVVRWTTPLESKWWSIKWSPIITTDRQKHAPSTTTGDCESSSIAVTNLWHPRKWIVFSFPTLYSLSPSWICLKTQRRLITLGDENEHQGY